MRKLAILTVLLILLTLPPVLPVTKPAQTVPQIVYVYYFPEVGRVKAGALKGVALVSSCDDATNLGATWEYAWSATAPDCPGIENVPMIFGAGQVGQASIAAVSGNSPWLMGFNEPDGLDQSNLTVAQAVEPWHRIELAYPDKKLVAPAPSQIHPNWLPEFRAAYLATYGKPPRFDALAVHCYYWTAQECIDLMQYYKGLAVQWQVREIWNTEFGFWTGESRSLKDAGAEMAKVVNWCNADPLCTRFAWFTTRARATEPWFAGGEWNGPANLLDYSTGLPTYFGKLYKGY